MLRPSKGDRRDDGYRFFRKGTDGYDVWLSPRSWNYQFVRQTHLNAKKRAEKKGLPFEIDVEYLLDIFPEDNRCPVFRMDLAWGGDRTNSPSLDRIHPALGYVPGNVMWISNYANTLKNGNSVATLKRLVQFYEGIARGD